MTSEKVVREKPAAVGGRARDKQSGVTVVGWRRKTGRSLGGFVSKAVFRRHGRCAVRHWQTAQRKTFFFRHTVRLSAWIPAGCLPPGRAPSGSASILEVSSRFLLDSGLAI